MNVHRSAEEVHREAKRHTRKRKKLLSMSSLEAKLDKIFSRFIRLRDADEGGTVSCVTCQKLMHFTEAHASHFVKRQHRATRWDERNVHAQCARENVYMGGSQDEMASYIAKKYGHETLHELLELKHTTRKFTRAELEEMCNLYAQKLSELDHANAINR